ncbi:MAG: YiiD C-terminal domain-containing protein [Bacteroidia bacterium]|nr:YiiD C-terminal domain-containing protein [Bacteroidia bacterium]
MKIPSWLLLIGMNLYPPLFWQGISVRRISRDYLAVDVVLRKALFNRNLAGTAFGGTIFSAADPFFSVMYWQALAHAGLDCESWLKASKINFIRPGSSRLRYEFRLKPADLDLVKSELAAHGKTEHWHQVQAIDRQGRLCAEAEMLCYVRLRNKS